MASEFVELIKKDKKAMEELSELVASEIALNPKFRGGLIKTVAGELATKEDIKELRAEIRETEERLRTEIKETRKELIAIMQIGFTGLGLLMVALGFYLGYVFR